MAVEGRAALESRSPLENELITSLAPHYDVVAHGRRLDKLEWPVYALLRPEFPDRLTIGPIDLTGPARHVYFGPYFALPAGVWSAHVSLEVQDCLSENRIGIDVFASKVLSVVHADLPPRGVYGCEVRFEIEDPSKPVEIRVQLLTGAIEGVILLRKIELHRLSSLDEVDEEDGLVESGMKFARTGIPIFSFPSTTALAWRRLGFRSAGTGLSKIGVVTALAPI